MHSSAPTLKPLDAVYHSLLRLITGDGFRTHRCILYEKAGWQPLVARREQHSICFIYKALLGKLPGYFTGLLSYRSISHCIRSLEYLALENFYVRTEIRKLAFKYDAPHKWNNLESF